MYINCFIVDLNKIYVSIILLFSYFNWYWRLNSIFQWLSKDTFCNWPSISPIYLQSIYFHTQQDIHDVVFLNHNCSDYLGWTNKVLILFLAWLKKRISCFSTISVKTSKKNYYLIFQLVEKLYFLLIPQN